jgi:hypothetical protein
VAGATVSAIPFIIDPRRVEKYFYWRTKGATKRFACTSAGISYSTAQRLEKEQGTDNGYDRAKERAARSVGPPKKYDDLCPEAKLALDDFLFFEERYLGLIPTPWQQEAADIVREKLATPDREFVLLNAPPSVGKTTTFTLAIPAWLTARDRAIRGGIFCASQALANRNVTRLKRLLERTIPVQADPELLAKGLARDAESTLGDDFGSFRPVARADRWAREEFVVEQLGGIPIDEKESTWTGFGFDSAFIGMRLDVLIADDVVDRKHIRNLEAITAQRETWDDVVERRVEVGGLLLLQGQRLGPNDLYGYAKTKTEGDEDDEVEGLDAQPMYTPIVFKGHYAERCQGLATHKRNAPAYPEGCLLDPRRLPWRDIVRARRNNPKTFSIIIQQQDTDPTGVLVKPIWVNGGTDPDDGTMHPGCWDRNRDVGVLPEGLKGDLLSYATVDPSAARWWSVQWWVTRVVDQVPQERYLMDHRREKMQASDLLDWQNPTQEFRGIMQWWQERSVAKGLPIAKWVVERNGCQRYLLAYEHVWRWCSHWRTEIVAHDTSANKLDPNFGVEQLIPGIYRYGLVRLPGKGNSTQDSLMAGGTGWMASMKLVDEVTNYPNALTSDCVMAQWFGEYWLPKMIGAGKPLPTLKRPSWMRGSDTYAWAQRWRRGA